MKLLSLAVVLCISAVVCAQTAPLPDAPSSEVKKRSKARGVTSLWPAVSAAGSTGPLTPKEKFLLFGFNTVNPFPIAAAAFNAGISQAFDTNSGYGQGGEGYAKRFGAAYADHASAQFLGTFLYPVLFRQDPRYFRMETGLAGSRVAYAISRLFVTRTDSGHPAPNISYWMATASSAVLSNTYYPPGDRSRSDAAIRFGVDFATQAGFNLVKEFWPDFKRKFLSKK